jgi:hypothetical protein
MAKGDEPRAKRHRHPPGGTPPATTFAGNMMVLVALALLFDEDEDRAESDPAD